MNQQVLQMTQNRKALRCHLVTGEHLKALRLYELSSSYADRLDLAKSSRKIRANNNDIGALSHPFS
jgi:hypothetical protein